MIFSRFEVFNFTKNNCPPLVFFTCFKLYKWYQIAQHIIFELIFSTYRWFRRVFIKDLQAFRSLDSSLLTFHTSRSSPFISFHVFLCCPFVKLPPNSNFCHLLDHKFSYILLCWWDILSGICLVRYSFYFRDIIPLFSLGWQAPGDTFSLKTLASITIIGSHK